jgi:hypothetical protein
MEDSRLKMAATECSRHFLDFHKDLSLAAADSLSHIFEVVDESTTNFFGFRLKLWRALNFTVSEIFQNNGDLHAFKVVCLGFRASFVALVRPLDSTWHGEAKKLKNANNEDTRR